jgi:predicted nucleic acid-binding protein
MMFLLDTNAFSDLMRKHSKLDARISSLAPADRVVICPIVRGEVRYGIEQLPQSKPRQDLETQAGPLSLLFRARQFLKRRAIIMRGLS